MVSIKAVLVTKALKYESENWWESHEHISALTNKYRTYFDSNSERFIALYGETAKFKIRTSSMCLF